MILPTIFLNGTSQDELVSQSIEVSRALTSALTKLRLATPNARDYVGRSRDLKTALDEHKSKTDRLISVLEETNRMTVALDTIGHG